MFSIKKLKDRIITKSVTPARQSLNIVEANKRIAELESQLAGTPQAAPADIATELAHCDKATSAKVESILTDHDRWMASEKTQARLKDIEQWNHYRNTMASNGLIEMDKPVVKQSLTSKALGGNGFYHIVQGDAGYYIATLKDGTVVIKKDNSLGRYHPLVIRGKFELQTAGRTDTERGRTQLQQYNYVNLSRAQFQHIVDTKPTFKDLCTAYDYLAMPQFDLDASESTPVL